MRAIQESTQRAFLQALSQRKVPSTKVGYHLKWLRYYLDFCAKYGFPEADRDSLDEFLQKLASKNQSADQQSQAAESIGVYYELRNGRVTPAAHVAPGGPEGGKSAASSADAGGAERSVAPIRDAVQNSQRPPSARPTGATYPRTESVVGERHAVREEMPVQAATDGAQPLESDDPRDWDEVRRRLKDVVAVKQYSPKTYKAYAGWVAKFAAFVRKPPGEVLMGDVKAYLTHLAVDAHVVASTQNQAFNSLLFLFRHIFRKEFDAKEGITRARQTRYIPVVLTRVEVDAVIKHARYPYNLIISLLYGCGLRLAECLNLRIQCLNFDDRMLTVHDGKGRKDRTVPLPERVVESLREHLERVCKLHEKDLANDDCSGVFLPGALSRKYRNAGREWIWQWVFPGKTLTLLPEEGEYRRYHLHESHVGKGIRAAVRKARIPKRATAHTFRHSFASHLLQANYDIRTIQEMMGHSDVRTTMIYTHTIKSRTRKERRSPLDFDDHIDGA